MTKDSFLIISMVATLALSGFSFAKSEDQNHTLSGQQSSLKSVVHVASDLAAKAAIDREDAVLKNVEARRSDCNNTNQLRRGLRDGVVQGEKNLPLFLKLLPSLNTSEVLRINSRTVRRELKSYKPLDCDVYARKALPPAEAKKITIAEQEIQIRKLVANEAAVAKKSARSRVVTVTQRCDLTELVLEATKSPVIRHKLAGSLAGCRKQLIKVEAEARG